MKHHRKRRLPESTHVVVGSAITIGLIFALILAFAHFGPKPAPVAAPSQQQRL